MRRMIRFIDDESVMRCAKDISIYMRCAKAISIIMRCAEDIFIGRALDAGKAVRFPAGCDVPTRSTV